MKLLFTTTMLIVACTTFSQSTLTNTASIGAGLFEQEKTISVSLAFQAEFNHEITRNVGIMAGYSYIKQQNRGGHTIYVTGNPIKAPNGQTFNQLSLLFNYKFCTKDNRIALRTGFGAINDLSNTYTTAQLDLIAFANVNIYPYLSWQPVFEGVDGWSHTVTFNLAINI